MFLIYQKNVRFLDSFCDDQCEKRISSQVEILTKSRLYQQYTGVLRHSILGYMTFQLALQNSNNNGDSTSQFTYTYSHY